MLRPLILIAAVLLAGCTTGPAERPATSAMTPAAQTYPDRYLVLRSELPDDIIMPDSVNWSFRQPGPNPSQLDGHRYSEEIGFNESQPNTYWGAVYYVRANPDLRFFLIVGDWPSEADAVAAIEEVRSEGGGCTTHDPEWDATQIHRDGAFILVWSTVTLEEKDYRTDLHSLIRAKAPALANACV